MVSRPLKEFKKSKSGRIFCSLSCAASLNNSESPKRQKVKRKCHYCGKNFTGAGKKYCSRECQYKAQIITKEEILRRIKNFYQKRERIPLKREFHHYDATRARFGTWNKAIKVAGFKPNPVIFAEKQKAKDGHICDSLSEKIIDDWLYARNIPHKINVPYDKNRMTADFNILIEFLGLQGQLKEYDRLLSEKKKLWKQKKIKIIKIYPKDLFLESKLNAVLNSLI